MTRTTVNKLSSINTNIGKIHNYNAEMVTDIQEQEHATDVLSTSAHELTSLSNNNTGVAESVKKVAITRQR